MLDLDKSMFQMAPEERQELIEEGQKRRSKYPLLNEDHSEFVYGVMSALGLRKDLDPVFDEENDIIRFPFLDEYWDRPGVIYMTTDEINRGNIKRFASQTKLALRNANDEGNLYDICDVSRIKGTDLLLGWAGT